VPDDAPEREGEGAEIGGQAHYAELAEAWVVKAWKLWAGGLKNWSAIAREVGKDRETVKKHVERYSATLEAMLDNKRLNPLVELLEGLHQDLAAQIGYAVEAKNAYVTRDGEVVEAPDYRTRVAARKEASAVRKDIAQARGVVTKREAQEVSGRGGADPSPPEAACPRERYAALHGVETSGCRGAIAQGPQAQRPGEGRDARRDGAATGGGVRSSANERRPAEVRGAEGRGPPSRPSPLTPFR